MRALAAAAPGTALAAALTAWRWSSKPMWRDEWITWSVTVRPLGSTAELLSERDGGLWPFYAVMHAWMALDGSVAWMRLPAAVATVVAVAATALVGRHAGGTLAGALAGVLVAVTPAIVDHAQEARAYPEVVAAVTLTALAALRYRERATPGRWTALTVLAALTVAAHAIPGVPAVVGVFVALLLSPGAIGRWRVVAAGLPAAVVSAALIGVGLRQVGLVLTERPAGWAAVADFRLVLAPGWGVLAAMAVLAAVATVSLRRSGASTGAGPGTGAGRIAGRGAALLLLAWALTPPLVLALLAAGGSFSTRRYLVAAVPAVCVLVAVGAVVVGRAVAARVARARPGDGAALAHRGAPAVALVLVGAVVAVLAPGALEVRASPYRVDDPRSAARFLAASYRAGDAVVYGGPFARGLTTYYSPAGAPPLPDPLLAETALASDTIDGMDVPPAQQAGAVAGAERLWVVATWDGRALEGQDVIDRVTAGRARVERRRFGGIVVQRWGPPGRGAASGGQRCRGQARIRASSASTNRSQPATWSRATNSSGACACAMSPGPHTTVAMPARSNSPASVP